MKGNYIFLKIVITISVNEGNEYVKNFIKMLFISLRDTVFHALDCGNLVRALQEERASVLLNTFLLDSENRDSKGKSKTKETNLVKNNKIDDNKNGNENAFKSTSQNITRNCDIKELSLTLSLAERLVRVNDFILE